MGDVWSLETVRSVDILTPRQHFVLNLNSPVSFFSASRVFDVLMAFHVWHLILFDAIVNRIIFWISFLDCSLLVYRKTIIFCLVCLVQSAGSVCWL